MTSLSSPARGLAGVVAADTVLSHVDGAGGRLIIRGVAVEDLAGQASYEDAAALLLGGFIDGSASESITSDIGAGRAEAYRRFVGLLGGGASRDPVEWMRFLLASIGDDDPIASPAALIGATGTAAAMAMRVAAGLPTIEPDAALSHALDLQRMITGQRPAPAEARAFETYLVTVIDHGLNASTFTARVVASTESGLVSAVVAALSALKGRLHGGAPGPVLDMLDAIGVADRAEAWIEERLDRGERIMGFGHRAYRVRDPRADVLREAIKAMGDRQGRLALARAVEEAALAVLARRKASRRLDVNVEFYTALLLESLGIARNGFTAVFAAGRVTGWIAHALEQQRNGNLIRPDARYVGPEPLARTA
ncbi:citrate synthase [Kaistia soli DSM 19436]|uniref:citrate synthase (unknown stereospecificity) n=1 Tax=Kaistia soli DSM 19436 TaxID=1122133 RepID=A0A1M5PYI9_9HYPH|nr:citrate synthase [Kaistia soli]SHH06529.1 citrate synthase [Kaistia soli DSM 19436]